MIMLSSEMLLYISCCTPPILVQILGQVQSHSFLSPLQTGSGLISQKKFGSRRVIDLRHALALCASYNVTQLHEASLLFHDYVVFLSNDTFVHFGFDVNFDTDTSTITTYFYLDQV